MERQPVKQQSWVPRPFGPYWLHNWLERHQHPFSFYLHLVGMPLTVIAVLLALLGHVWWALALFVGGYLVQFLGHALEGTDPGEIILLKRQLGWSYVDIAPARKSPRGVA